MSAAARDSMHPLADKRNFGRNAAPRMTAWTVTRDDSYCDWEGSPVISVGAFNPAFS
jgi:hypothetical protein